MNWHNSKCSLSFSLNFCVKWWIKWQLDKNKGKHFRHNYQAANIAGKHSMIHFCCLVPLNLAQIPVYPGVTFMHGWNHWKSHASRFSLTSLSNTTPAFLILFYSDIESLQSNTHSFLSSLILEGHFPFSFSQLSNLFTIKFTSTCTLLLCHLQFCKCLIFVFLIVFALTIPNWANISRLKNRWMKNII